MAKGKKLGKKPPRHEKQMVGWREWVRLPQFHVDGIKAKVDTGATTSCLHAEDVIYFKSHGRQMVRFNIYPVQRDNVNKVSAVAEVIDRRQVRSSNGKSQERTVIKTEVELMGERWPIEITLANRDLMGFRMLLGREALRGRFTVDPAKSYRGKMKSKVKGKG